MILRTLRQLIARSRADTTGRALRDALGNVHCKSSSDLNLPILVISHDAHLAGAQRLLLSILSEWNRVQALRIKIICVRSGDLRNEFEHLFPTLTLSDFGSERARVSALVKFVGRGVRAIFSNTVVNGPLLGPLRALNVPVFTYCHELQAAIERWAAGTIMVKTLTNTDFFFAASTSVARNLHVRHSVPNERLKTVYASIDFWDQAMAPQSVELTTIRSELGLQPTDVVVFGCGTTDWRKGPDLFLAVALRACTKHNHLKFVWIGGEAAPDEYQSRIDTSGLTARIQFIGNREQARRYFYAGHIFALASREDPCALVALEAANAKLPVVSFAGTGDIPTVLGESCGAVVPFEDTDAFTAAILRLAEDAELRSRCGIAGYERVSSNHTSESAAEVIRTTIAELTEHLPRKALGQVKGSPLVSVLVPNYNHRRFLDERLRSIANQSVTDLEIILLDDASTDDSRELLENFMRQDSRARLLPNESNSGSTFKQWFKGLSLAQGKYVWIAESDDAAHPTLLEKAVAKLESDSSIVLVQAQSLMIDTEGNSLGRPDSWLDELANGRWRSNLLTDGILEIRHFLSQKNTIPNASAVVFRNFPGIEFLVDQSMRLCADWLFWIRLLTRGKYCFIQKELNLWRQNSSNARTRTPGIMEWEEGQRIIVEIDRLLKCEPAEREQMLAKFKKRCMEWSGGELQ